MNGSYKFGDILHLFPGLHLDIQELNWYNVPILQIVPLNLILDQYRNEFLLLAVAIHA